MSNSLKIDENQLKKVIKDCIVEVLTERKDLLEDSIIDVIEDIGLISAIEKELHSEVVDKNTLMKDLEERINS